MIVKVSGNNSPFYLQKNILNLGFMPINTSNHYYYMEIFKGEEGEIMLHNKIHNGYLLSKIIQKTNKNESDIEIDDFPKYEDEKNTLFNKYNDFSKKLNISSYETDECDNGCYLLITYYSPEINMQYLDGIEYTLLGRIWDENEFRSQIVNIPLNEYIFGTIESSSINTHYYSIYIPENNDILFEFQGRNIQAFAKKGILQINIFKKTINLILTENISEIEEEKLIIKLDKEKLGLESIENKYISFAFGKINDDKFSNSLINYYYFRIIQEDSKNKYTIYPLDTNKVNLCQTSKLENNYICYFLLTNDYKQFNNNCSIYAYGLEEANYYKAWPINQVDYYSIDINNIKGIYNNSEIQKRYKGGYFQLHLIDNFNYILLEIHSNHQEILEVLFNFDEDLINSPSLNIYSYQSYFLETKKMKNFYFNTVLFDQFTVIIINTSGDGYICINQNCNSYKSHLSEKIFLSFTISEEIKSINFYSEKNLFFYLKIKNKMKNNIMERAAYGNSFIYIGKTSEYSKAYYIKDNNGYGLDINFFFKFNDINIKYNNINIFGYIVSYDDIKYIDNYEYLELLPEITGIYDPCTKSGLLSFDNDMVKNESLKKDIYFIFRFIPNNNISELFAEIFIDSKNESLFNLQKSQYIRGSLNLNNREKIQKKTFYIKFEEDYKYSSVNNTHILEFSSNLENIKPIFNNDFNYFNNITIGGVEKYYFSTENLTKGYIYNFTIQLNNLSNNKSLNNIGRPFYFANYIIKFYEEKYDNNFDFIIDKSYDHKNISNGSKQISYCNFSIKSNNLNFNLNEKNNYTYFVRLYYKQLLFFFEPQILNTIAFIPLL